jgi:hypothetical protein
MAHNIKTNSKDSHDCLDGRHLVIDELICHFPYAVFSVAISLIVLTILDLLVGNSTSLITQQQTWFNMFHSFHFVHIVFASVGAMITFSKFSNDRLRGLVVSAASAMVFCILSDILMPYIGATMLGIDMKLHICFWSELHNILPFLLIGLLTGWLITAHHKNLDHDSMGMWSHFTHIFVSSMASMFYMVSSGFTDWVSQIGMLFLLLIFAVVIPCTLSDVVVPILFAKPKK